MEPRDSPARFRRTDAIFDALLDLPTACWPDFIDSECGDDGELKAAVERLVRAFKRSDGFLADSAAEFASPLLAAEGLLPTEPTGPARVGPFRIVRELGRGGMGAVYLGERDDGQFRQSVAIKLIRGGLGGGLLQRFLTERQILASLSHPGICRLLDGGVTPDGVPYFAMEYVVGEPIDVYCARHQPPLEERLRLFRDVCTAVQYAHVNRVVHRDLKPANILVTEEGEVKLLDFGVARLILEEAPDGSGVTRTVVRAITPEYAAPEQVRGEPATIASDIYALGMLLYELLIGERPYRLEARSPAEVERVVCETEPVAPSAAARRGAVEGHTTDRPRIQPTPWRRLTGDLDTVVLKALHKVPERRYGSAAALLADLLRFQQGRPVLARPDRWTYRLRSYVRRHRSRLWAAAAVVTLPVVYVGVYAGAIAAARDGTSTGVTRPVGRILVADFSSSLHDSVLVRAVGEAVRIDLAQFPGVRVLSPQQVAGTLRLMDRGPDLTVNDSIAAELAAREGVSAIVSGEIERVAGRYVVSLRLVSTTDGELLTAARETTDSLKLMDAVGRLTRTLRQDLGEGRASLRESPALVRVTTASLPALRLFSEALYRNEALSDRAAAIRLLEQAIVIDPGFASAYRVLGSLYRSNADHARALAASRRAFELRDRLSVRERYLTMGSYYLNVTGEHEKAVSAYVAQLAREPDDKAALNNLSLVYRERRQFVEQERLLRQVIALDSTIAIVYLGLAEALAHQSRFDDAVAVMHEIDRRFPGNPIAPMTWAYVHAAQQDWAAAERYIRIRLEQSIAGGRTHNVIDARQTLGQILLATGRIREAEQELRQSMDLATQEGQVRRVLFSAVQLGWLEARFRQRPDRALAIIDSALARFPLPDIESGDRPYVELAGLFAGLGEAGRVQELLRVADRDAGARPDLEKAAGDMMRGYAAMLSGRHRQAVLAFHNRERRDRCTNCALPALGEGYERMGDIERAILSYERYLSTPYIWRFETDAPHLAWTLKRLAELYERSGRTVEANRMRERLQVLWRNADAGVS